MRRWVVLHFEEPRQARVGNFAASQGTRGALGSDCTLMAVSGAEWRRGMFARNIDIRQCRAQD